MSRTPQYSKSLIVVSNLIFAEFLLWLALVSTIKTKPSSLSSHTTIRIYYELIYLVLKDIYTILPYFISSSLPFISCEATSLSSMYILNKSYASQPPTLG